jgi:hypothetical protein
MYHKIRTALLTGVTLVTLTVSVSPAMAAGHGRGSAQAGSRTDGLTWTIVPSPNRPGHRENLLFGVSCPSAHSTIPSASPARRLPHASPWETTAAVPTGRHSSNSAMPRESYRDETRLTSWRKLDPSCPGTNVEPEITIYGWSPMRRDWEPHASRTFVRSWCRKGAFRFSCAAAI